MLYALLAAAVLVIVAQQVVLYLVYRRNQQTIDMLTSKIMAPDLNNYTVNRQAEQKPVVQRRESKGVGVGLFGPREDLIPISQANPEEVMQALERQGGFGEE
jgi:hypothetical protein